MVVQSEFEAAQKGIEVRCLSWNPSRFDTPMIVVGCTTAKEAQGHKKSTDSVMVKMRCAHMLGVPELMGRRYGLSMRHLPDGSLCPS